MRKIYRKNNQRSNDRIKTHKRKWNSIEINIGKGKAERRQGKVKKKLNTRVGD